MKTVGIIAEYNPFHNGHQWHLEETRRRSGDDAVLVACMSGDFVQRGEPAIYSKFARAEAACRCGADLVVELPLPWCIASAEGFARAGVRILASLGAETLSFGCETENLEEMRQAAALVGREDFLSGLRELLRAEPEQSFAAARQKLAEQKLGKPLPWMREPNSILALEYLKAIREGGYADRMEPLAVLRRGAGHDATGYRTLSSASELRSRLRAGEKITEAVPAAAEEIFLRERTAGREAADWERFGLLMLSRLRFLKEEDFLRLPGAGDGLGGRLYDAVRREKDYPSVVRAAATRRYPLARVRRLALYAVLGVTDANLKATPEYIRVLAFNERGRELLHRESRGSELPVLTKAAQVHELSPEAESLFALGASAHDFYTLLYPADDMRFCGEDWRHGPALCTESHF